MVVSLRGCRIFLSRSVVDVEKSSPNWRDDCMAPSLTLAVILEYTVIAVSIESIGVMLSGWDVVYILPDCP